MVLASPSFAGRPYFQQRVNYNIRVGLDPATAKLTGTETVFYFNNSPDTLGEVFFHLYYNAYTPGSHLDIRSREEGDYSLALAAPRDWGYAKIDLLKAGGIVVDTYFIDDTIMRVPLRVPLLPGDSTYFYIEFKSQIPAQGSRAAHRGNHFDVGQWYPKPALYDRRGWHANQYYDETEFFSDYGEFDIEVTLAKEFTLAHVGTLMNEREVFDGLLPVPDDDSIIVNALDHVVKDSTTKSYSTLEVTESDTLGSMGELDSLRTWKISARNVHDFAFSADANFKLDICHYEDCIIKVFYNESTEGWWRRNAADYARKSIRLFSETYYPWPYPQYSVATSVVSGGMEYPDFCMISSKYNSENRFETALESTIAHEVSHAWFYGILGFNETEESFLDEGLASFATTQYLEDNYGRFRNNYVYERSWQKKLLPNGNDRNDCQKLYIQKAISQTEDPLNTSAVFFKDGWRYYNASYYKASSVYFMLQYVMGYDNFDRFIRTLFQRWAFKHPSLVEFRALAEEVYGADLTWFFRQWFSTTWTLDYSLEKFETRKHTSNGHLAYKTDVVVKRKGRCISPLDLVFHFNGGSSDTVLIPVTCWLDNQIYYDTTLSFALKPSKVTINPDLRLADINRLDNSSGTPPVNFQFMVPRFIYPANYIEYYTGSYAIAHNPSLWYNSVDGLKLGYAARGSYLSIQKALDLEATIGLRNGNTNYNLRYDNPLPSFHPQISYYCSSREWDGRGRQELGLHYQSYNMEDVNTTVADLSLRRHYLFDSRYLYANGWSPGNVNTIDLSLVRKTSFRYSTVIFQGSLSSSLLESDYYFTRFAGALGIHVSGIGVGESRVFIKAGRADGNVPFQRRFYLSSADPYDIWDSPLFRSKGTLPDRWKRDGHLFKPGGAGLNGYGRLEASGTRMLSLKITNDLPRAELPIEVPCLSGQMSRVTSEAYFAGGFVWDDTIDAGFDDFLWEAGLHFEYQVPYLDLFMSENKLSLYIPIWLSDPHSGDESLKWRWLFSFTP